MWLVMRSVFESVMSVSHIVGHGVSLCISHEVNHVVGDGVGLGVSLYMS